MTLTFNFFIINIVVVLMIIIAIIVIVSYLILLLVSSSTRAQLNYFLGRNIYRLHFNNCDVFVRYSSACFFFLVCFDLFCFKVLTIKYIFYTTPIHTFLFRLPMFWGIFYGVCCKTEKKLFSILRASSWSWRTSGLRTKTS